MSKTEDQRAARLATAREPRRLPRRFYEQAATGDAAPFAVLLDGRPVKTPGKAALEVPGLRLAEAIAGEWQAQAEHVDPDLMPLTRLANTAIDRVRPDKARIVDEIVHYAGSDLVCYRAGEPQRLVERQQAAWDPVMEWTARRCGAPFIAVTGIMPHQQPEPALAGIRAAVAEMGSFRLTALHNVMTLTGSALIACAVAERHLAADDAWTAAHIDEDWNIELWGRDAEADAVRARRKSEFDGVMAFLALLE